MINYWWVTRPKRRLNSVPESLSTLTSVALDKIWQGDVDLHLSFESSLEKDGVKKVGERRDQTGGGARTYVAWLKSLGLIFKQDHVHRYHILGLKYIFFGGHNSMDNRSNVINLPPNGCWLSLRDILNS